MTQDTTTQDDQTQLDTGAYGVDYDPNDDPNMTEMAQRIAAMQPDWSNAEKETIAQPQRDTGNTPMEMQTTPASIVKVWHRPTGQPRRILRDLLHHISDAVDHEGNPIFSFEPVELPSLVGGQICRLHPDHANRKLWNQMGLPTCSKADLDNDYQVRNHMERTHKTAWQAIQQYDTELRELDIRREREENLQFQRETLANMSAMIERFGDVMTAFLGTGHQHSYDDEGDCTVEDCDAKRP